MLGDAGGQAGGHLAGGGHHLGGEGGAQVGVADDPQGIAAAGDAAGELGVIGEHRVHPHQDGPEPVPLGVDVAAGFLPGDPLGGPGVGGHLSVQGHGVLQDHIGLSCLDVVKEHLVEGPALGLQYVLGHLDPVGPEDSQPFPRHLGVGVPRPHHHPGDAGFQNGLGTRGLAALVAAGLQGDIHGGPGGVLGAGGQGSPLGVEVPTLGVVPLADDLAVLDDHGPHHGVGAGPPGAFLGQRESLGHIFLVGHSDTSQCKKRSEANLQSASKQAQVSRVFSHEKTLE